MKKDDLKTDVLVIGAGVIGSAVGMGLARLGVGKGVTVVDFDLEGSLSSSELNAGGVRATFNQPLNVAASKFTLDYFRTIATEIGFRESGYLWLCTEEQRRAREKQIPLWEKYEWPVDVMSVDQVQSKYPILDRMEGVSCGLFGRRDGLLNPNLLKLHYRAEARKQGAVFRDRWLLREGVQESGRWKLTFDEYSSVLDPAELRALLSGNRSAAVSSQVVYADQVVNCAGAWAGSVAKSLGYETAATPVRRQISLFDCRGGDFSDYGMIIDTSGVYFHPESTFFLSGVAEKEEPNGINFQYGGEEFFQEKIWFPLSERATRFEQLKHVSGWAGLYEISPDESAIIGGAGDGLFEAHSFSGHGVMHSYCAGIALAEKIVHGRYESFDFSSLQGQRFKTGHLISETAVI